MTNSGRPELQSSGFASAEPSSSMFEQFRVPIAKSFSFVIPERFRSNNPFVVGWVDNLPGEVKREEPLAPAQTHAPKHSLDTLDQDEEDSHDGHRNKRARIGSALGRHPVSEKRRSRLSKPGINIVRRASNVYQRVFSRNSDDSSTGSTAQPSPLPPGTPSTPDRPRMRFVFVGDSGCGKSNLLLRYYNESYNPAYVPTHYELFDKTTNVDGQDVDLELWDTSGDFEQHQLKLLSYLAWDAVFLCFSLDSLSRFTNAQTKWVDEIRKHCRGVPIILTGLKKDTRIGSGMWAPLYPHMTARICATEGSRAAGVMRAIKYMECSAKTGENVNHVFEEGVRLVLNERAEEEELARLRSHSDAILLPWNILRDAMGHMGSRIAIEVIWGVPGKYASSTNPMYVMEFPM
ncbi:P-loop containing nucleoside triphosphate hydrolase protein [Hypoxylon rubiginosum]|uniref:P-loop containing nucleoside triphosphate hydrolase protein n=1 Tax=Hypoxylon rubiginosum TaxID=110542 RepID=A0ACB9YJ77_9PEZI|nr:P-loop containing nucleoside triphosphate hydrolase protein [Hypoxylon rubiginosum]